MRGIRIVLFLLLLIVLCLFKPAWAQRLDVCFKRTCFNVTVARSREERMRGLMFRTKLDYHQGMLFVFDSEDMYGFWMKNTLIPLDIIWADKDKRVVFIERNAEPCPENQEECPVIYPDDEALYVLEIGAGISDDVGLEVGEALEFNLP